MYFFALDYASPMLGLPIKVISLRLITFLCQAAGSSFVIFEAEVTEGGSNPKRSQITLSNLSPPKPYFIKEIVGHVADVIVRHIL